MFYVQGIGRAADVDDQVSLNLKGLTLRLID